MTSEPVSKQYFDERIDEVLEVVQIGFSELRTEMRVENELMRNRVEVLEEKSDKQYEILRAGLERIDRHGVEIKEHREKIDLHDSRLNVLETRGK